MAITEHPINSSSWAPTSRALDPTDWGRFKEPDLPANGRGGKKKPYGRTSHDPNLQASQERPSSRSIAWHVAWAWSKPASGLHSLALFPTWSKACRWAVLEPSVERLFSRVPFFWRLLKGHQEGTPQFFLGDTPWFHLPEFHFWGYPIFDPQPYYCLAKTGRFFF